MFGLIANMTGGTFVNTTATFTIEEESVYTFAGGVWVAGHFSVDSSTVKNTGYWEILAASGTMEQAGAVASSFTNQAGAVISKTAGGPTTFDIPFTNAGDINLNGRALHLKKNLTHTGGTIDLGINGTLDMATGAGKGTYDLQGGKLKGVGNVDNVNVNKTGGTVEAVGMPLPLRILGNFLQWAGDLIVSMGTGLEVSEQLALHDGTAQVYADLEVGSYLQTGGTLDMMYGTLRGAADDFQVDDGIARLRYVSADVDGSLLFNGGEVTLNMSSSFVVDDGLCIGLEGYVEWEGGP